MDKTSTAVAVRDSIASAPEMFRVELAPELLLPAQFHAGFRNDASLCPEKRLMLAVLEAAVADFQRCAAILDAGGQSLFREAVTWFESEDTTWPYSFVNVCQALGLEVTYVLAGLRRWRDAQRAQALRGKPAIRILLRRMAGIRSKATGYAPMGRVTPRR
jgi:hypothetical protein